MRRIIGACVYGVGVGLFWVADHVPWFKRKLKVPPRPDAPDVGPSYSRGAGRF